MNIRKLTQLAVDADVENGATTPVIAMSEDGLMYSIKDVVIDPTSYDDGGNPTSTGPTIFLMIEEM